MFIGVCGHASSEFVARIISNNSAINSLEISVWRFVLGGLGLVIVAVFIPSSRDFVTPVKRDGLTLLASSVFGVSIVYLFFHWSLDYATASIFVGLINMVANKVLIGIGMAILCALFMSVYLVLIKSHVARWGALLITAITLFMGGLVLWLGVRLLFGRWVDFTTLPALPGAAVTAILVLVL